jgi:protease-4
VVVYMGNQAASGGYYVSAPAMEIIAQPTTLTGSIGIWGGKLVTSELFAKSKARREIVSRGRAAGLYSDTRPFTPGERERIQADIGAGYVRFKARVAKGRGMDDEDVESLARGRVWTGEQARARALVDEIGDLWLAAERARKLAKIDPRRHAPLASVQSPRRWQLPVPQPTEAGEWIQGLMSLAREGLWAMAPWGIRIRG